MDNTTSPERELTRQEQKKVLKLLSLLSKLNSIQIFGCATLLRIPLAEEGSTIENFILRPSDALVSDILDAFIALSPRDQRNLLALIEGGKLNG